MRDSLQEKIKSILLLPEVFKEEAYVIYFLVEAGKLLERDHSNTEYPLVKFYRDWAVHTEKKYNLHIIESYFIPTQGNFDIKTFALMDDLQEQISDFLKYNFISDFTEQTKVWAQFVHSLTKVLADQPVLLNSNPQSPIASFRYKNHNTRLIYWEVELKSGTRQGYVSGYYLKLNPNQ